MTPILTTPKRLAVALMAMLIAGAGIACAVGLCLGASDPASASKEVTEAEQARTTLASIDAACMDYLNDQGNVRALITQYGRAGINVVNGNQPVSAEVQNQLGGLVKAKETCRAQRLGEGLAEVSKAGYTWSETCLNASGARLTASGQVRPGHGQKIADLNACATLKPTTSQCDHLYEALSGGSSSPNSGPLDLTVVDQRIYEVMGCVNGR